MLSFIDEFKLPNIPRRGHEKLQQINLINYETRHGTIATKPSMWAVPNDASAVARFCLFTFSATVLGPAETGIETSHKWLCWCQRLLSAGHQRLGFVTGISEVLI